MSWSRFPAARKSHPTILRLPARTGTHRTGTIDLRVAGPVAYDCLSGRKKVRVDVIGGNADEFSGALSGTTRDPSRGGCAIITEVEGVVTFGKDTKGKRRIVVTPEGEEAHEYLIPKGKNIVVSEKDGHLRAAVHFYNSEDDLTRFLDALQAA